MYKSSAACVCRRPLAVVVERVGESCRVIWVRVVEIAAELDGAIMVIVVVGVGAFQLGEIEARRRTIRLPEFVPVPESKVPESSSSLEDQRVATSRDASVV